MRTDRVKVSVKVKGKMRSITTMLKVRIRIHGLPTPTGTGNGTMRLITGTEFRQRNGLNITPSNSNNSQNPRRPSLFHPKPLKISKNISKV